MDRDEIIPAGKKRRLQVYVDDSDVLVEALEIAKGDYECVMVNSSWVDRGLLEGDVVLFSAGAEAAGGDIVLIEQGGRVRIGLIVQPGVLDTPQGHRPLAADERIIGVGHAL